MRRFQAIIASVLILCAGLAAAAATTPSQPKDSEEAAVRQVVQQYLDGLKYNDVERFKKAFWPDAKLFFVKRDGQLGQLTQTQWYEGFKESAGKEEKGDLRITALDITGNAASVKVEEDYPNSKYIDYLSLLKFNGEWKIVNKIYTSQRKKTASE
jgi:ketosteroid isomerase-like protein